jgi:hypothetical protein
MNHAAYINQQQYTRTYHAHKHTRQYNMQLQDAC